MDGADEVGRRPCSTSRPCKGRSEAQGRAPGRSWVLVTGRGSPEREWSLLRAPLQATPLGVAAADAQY